ncbi:MAG: TIGR03667 family PPOX class F420-dependent oxidoreductase [Anaerolineales bacterium]|nr:TIGR03667 family PPOX class F420-dependent oxidoreductase [Anaerolineae bacterium]PWB75121.1 MAG: TIGR03667 family PPOX class F420-dependent oxidoreductase [Anaerolineales bacterium]
MFDLNSKFGRVVKRHLKNEYFVWLTTVDSKGTPQPRPVWFIWDEDDTFLIFSQPNAYKIKHLNRNPNVSLHFNTEDEEGDKHVIVFTGVASFDTASPPAHKVPAYIRKYRTGIAGLKMSPEEFSNEYSRAIRIKPTEVRGWV